MANDQGAGNPGHRPGKGKPSKSDLRKQSYPVAQPHVPPKKSAPVRSARDKSSMPTAKPPSAAADAPLPKWFKPLAIGLGAATLLMVIAASGYFMSGAGRKKEAKSNDFLAALNEPKPELAPVQIDAPRPKPEEPKVEEPKAEKKETPPADEDTKPAKKKKETPPSDDDEDAKPVKKKKETPPSDDDDKPAKKDKDKSKEMKKEDPETPSDTPKTKTPDPKDKPEPKDKDKDTPKDKDKDKPDPDAKPKTEPPEKPKTEAKAAEVTFAQHVLPILKSKCMGCHSGAKKKAGLDVSSVANLVKGGDNGAAVTAGSLEKSLLWEAISSDMMPPEDPKLTAAEKKVIQGWITGGKDFAK